MRWSTMILAAFVVAVPTLASAGDTASCEGKWSWQRHIVRSAVHRWFWNESRSSDLLELIQAEQGIAACASTRRPLRLHTTRLPEGLAVDQFGAVLLANELQWSGLMPAPEEGLVGEWIPVKTRSGAAE